MKKTRQHPPSNTNKPKDGDVVEFFLDDGHATKGVGILFDEYTGGYGQYDCKVLLLFFIDRINGQYDLGEELLFRRRDLKTLSINGIGGLIA